MKPYPKFQSGNQKDIEELLQFIRQERVTDIADFTNLTNIFMSGRKVGKLPSGSADVADTDRIGDINYDASYLYILINNAGTAEWRRATLASW